MHSIREYVNIFVTLVAIVDPLGAVPIFVSLTSDQSPQARRWTAWITAFTVALVLIGSAWFGGYLLGFFGISISSFRIAGGILLLMMGISMLHAQSNYGVRRPGEAAQEPEKDSIAVIPLAIPLLSGPGAISSMTIFSYRDRTWTHLAVLTGISILVAGVTGATLRLSQPISRMLGKTGVNVAVRLMGLLLSAVAVQFIADGMIQLFPALIARSK